MLVVLGGEGSLLGSCKGRGREGEPLGGDGPGSLEIGKLVGVVVGGWVG